MKIAIITPVWNRADLTQKFLAEHWGMYAGQEDVHWIVIDNASTDSTPQVLKSWLGVMDERLTVATLPENIGFGPGNNLGAANCGDADIIVFLSNDVRVKGDYINPLVTRCLDQPLALYGAQEFSHNTGWNTFKKGDISPYTIPYMAGWCVAGHRDLWAKIGFWDDRFVPCDYEDLDLSYRALQAGIPLQPLNLPLYHESGKSAERLEGGRLQVTLANQKRFLEKWGLELFDV